MLEHIALRWIQIQRLSERCFGAFVLLVVAHHAADLFQQRDFVVYRIAGDRAQPLKASLPLLDGFRRHAAPLQCAAKVHMRRREVRIARQRRAQRRFRASLIAKRLLQS